MLFERVVLRTLDSCMCCTLCTIVTRQWRTACSRPQGYEHPEAVVEVWLRCLVAGQYFSDRLLLDIRAVEYHMDFWKNRLKSGNNTLFLAVARGPRKFAQALAELLRRLRGQPSRMMLRPTHRIEQRVRS